MRTSKIKRVVIDDFPERVYCEDCKEGFAWSSPILFSVWEEMIIEFLKKHKKHKLVA